MSQSPVNFSKPIITLISTVFGIGYIPRIPGTVASFLGVLVFWFVRDDRALSVITLASVTAGFLIAGKAEEVFKKKDAQCIVIDEFSGMLLSLLFIPGDLRFIITGFILFRIMDILKPFPAYRVQALEGSMGVMIDDIIAAVYTNVILRIVLILSR